MITDVSQSSALAKRSSNRTDGPGVDLLHLAHEEPGDVEVVDGHVEERAAAGEQELERGRVGVARQGAELLDAAELARVDELLGALVARVEPAHEPDLDRESGLLQSSTIFAVSASSWAIGFSVQTALPARRAASM